MKLIPILMSAPMVRANLAGLKTQTRRELKNPEYYGCPTGDCPHGTQAECDRAMNEPDVLAASRFGKPGDLLWAREAWCSPEKGIVGYASTAECGAIMDDGDGGSMWLRHGYILESPAYGECFKEPANTYGLKKYGGRWRPSIHMPRWACRLVLRRVGEVRIELLGNISRLDAIAEGMTGEGFEDGTWSKEVLEYFSLWDELNGPGAAGLNPWVWVIRYEVAANTLVEAQKLLRGVV